MLLRDSQSKAFTRLSKVCFHETVRGMLSRDCQRNDFARLSKEWFHETVKGELSRNCQTNAFTRLSKECFHETVKRMLSRNTLYILAWWNVSHLAVLRKQNIYKCLFFRQYSHCFSAENRHFIYTIYVCDLTRQSVTEDIEFHKNWESCLRCILHQFHSG